MIITKKGAKLVVDGVEFDLSEYGGKKVTIFRDADGSLTMESKPVHQVTICELVVPKAVIISKETGETDKEELPVMEDVIMPMNLGKTIIKKFEEVV